MSQNIPDETFICSSPHPHAVAFRIYDMDKDGYISNGELFQVLKMMVGNNLKDTQLQQIVDKTIINADKDGDGRISFEEFCAVSLLSSRPPKNQNRAGFTAAFSNLGPKLVVSATKGRSPFRASSHVLTARAAF